MIKNVSLLALVLLAFTSCKTAQTSTPSATSTSSEKATQTEKTKEVAPTPTPKAINNQTKQLNKIQVKLPVE